MNFLASPSYPRLVCNEASTRTYVLLLCTVSPSIMLRLFPSLPFLLVTLGVGFGCSLPRLFCVSSHQKPIYLLGVEARRD